MRPILPRLVHLAVDQERAKARAVDEKIALDPPAIPVDTAALYANLPLAGLSKYSFNVAGFYDKANIHARIAYSWRSKFLLTTRDCCFPFLPVHAPSGDGQMAPRSYFISDRQFSVTTRLTF